jgi:5'(3')-deoxyribonucleotidase
MDSNKIILIDLDGVLAHFNKAVSDVFNIDYSNIEDNWTPGNWSIATELKLSEGEIWARINKIETFWEDIELYPYAKNLVKYLKSKYEVNVCTSPSYQVHCATGKMKWLLKHKFGFGRNIVITPQKHLLAGPNKVLIDDMDANCDKFKKHGGETILFPQVWNSGGKFDGDRLEYIKSVL